MIAITPAQLAALTAIQRCPGQVPAEMARYAGMSPIVFMRRIVELADRGAICVDESGLYQADTVIAIYE